MMPYLKDWKPIPERERPDNQKKGPYIPIGEDRQIISFQSYKDNDPEADVKMLQRGAAEVCMGQELVIKNMLEGGLYTKYLTKCKLSVLEGYTYTDINLATFCEFPPLIVEKVLQEFFCKRGFNVTFDRKEASLYKIYKHTMVLEWSQKGEEVKFDKNI